VAPDWTVTVLVETVEGARLRFPNALDIAARTSADARMIAAFEGGQDLHRLTASLLTGKPLAEVTPDDRLATKAVNFGLIYAMGAEGLRDDARPSDDVELGLAEVGVFIDRFFRAYPRVVAWHAHVKRRGASACRTLSGRRRRWAVQPPLTELVNTPVQGRGRHGLTDPSERPQGKPLPPLANCRGEVRDGPGGSSPTMRKIFRRFHNTGIDFHRRRSRGCLPLRS
jgi:hypothetical protein